MHIDSSFVNVVDASGSVAVHALVDYLRARLRDGAVREGVSSATFEHVRVPDKVDRELSIRVSQARGDTRMEVRDTTPPPAPNLPDEAARWKHVGLTPQGRIADPTHLE
jgi:hypothetical protein